jgi:hypothetical protein
MLRTLIVDCQGLAAFADRFDPLNAASRGAFMEVYYQFSSALFPPCRDAQFVLGIVRKCGHVFHGITGFFGLITLPVFGRIDQRNFLYATEKFSIILRL